MKLFGSIGKILGVWSPVHVNVFTAMNGCKIGEDSLGNFYYQGEPKPGKKRYRRWVIYKNDPDPALIPPEWHGWLHHQTDYYPGCKAQEQKG